MIFARIWNRVLTESDFVTLCHARVEPRLGYKLCPGCFQPVMKDNEDDCDHIFCSNLNRFCLPDQLYAFVSSFLCLWFLEVCFFKYCDTALEAIQNAVWSFAGDVWWIAKWLKYMETTITSCLARKHIMSCHVSFLCWLKVTLSGPTALTTLNTRVKIPTCQTSASWIALMISPALKGVFDKLVNHVHPNNTCFSWLTALIERYKVKCAASAILKEQYSTTLFLHSAIQSAFVLCMRSERCCITPLVYKKMSKAQREGYPEEGWTAYAVRKEKEMEACSDALKCESFVAGEVSADSLPRKKSWSNSSVEKTENAGEKKLRSVNLRLQRCLFVEMLAILLDYRLTQWAFSLLQEGGVAAVMKFFGVG